MSFSFPKTSGNGFGRLSLARLGKPWIACRMAADVRSQSNKNRVLRETCRYRLCVSTCRQTVDTTFAVTLELFLDGGRQCLSIPRWHLHASRQRKVITTEAAASVFP